jgi:pimeloyl-ACP methyl ester carboxylesterase
MLTGLIAAGLWVMSLTWGMTQPSVEAPVQTKEINFVFLHGAGSTACALQPLADQVVARLPDFIQEYEAANPGIKLTTTILNRCYPNDTDVETWAKNVVDSIDKYSGNQNFILIGHSMGGKAALYATSHNLDGIADKVRAVVTINTPVRNLSQYNFVAGINYWSAISFLPQDQGAFSPGVATSVAYYDSAGDGRWVGTNRHWLAFVSGESAPSSPQFDLGGMDPLPKDMDDTIVPISAQYSEGADVIYYGEHAHGDFTESDELSGNIANQILRYIFGKRIEVSVFNKSGTFEHEAGWMPVVDKWEDSLGSTTVSSGKIVHRNDSLFRWQEWEDVVGEGTGTGNRDSYKLRMDSPAVLTGIVESRWQTSAPDECWLYVKTRAAPQSTVQIGWSVDRNMALAGGFQRDRWEVEIISGTPFTGIGQVAWLSANPRDLKLNINSQAEGPYRWYKAQWRVYLKVPRVRRIMSELQ